MKTPLYKRSYEMEQSIESYSCNCVCSGCSCGCSCPCRVNLSAADSASPDGSAQSSYQNGMGAQNFTNLQRPH